jgi:rare lipoprotein A
MQLQTNALKCAILALCFGAIFLQPAIAQQPVYASQDAIDYDEVGYASIVEGNGGISAVHPSLPVPSYAEVTDIDTGRTILVRISDRGAVGKGNLIGLSAAAAQQLGAGGGRVSVRVRRTNPPQHEKTALDNGQAAAERLATPPSLLNALRKKLGVAPAVAVAAAPTKLKPLKPIPKLLPPVRPTAGADFSESAPDTEPMPEQARQPARETSRRPVQQGGDRFIVEENGVRARPAQSRPHWVVGAGAPPAERQPIAVQAPAAVATPYFVQVAAFGMQSRATAVARQIGGSTVQAGSIWRVRKGPFASEESARWALGQLVAKGYSGARVTR